jgi:hypothetical protein
MEMSELRKETEKVRHQSPSEEVKKKKRKKVGNKEALSRNLQKTNANSMLPMQEREKEAKTEKKNMKRECT